MKKIICVIMSVIFAVLCVLPAYGADVSQIGELKSKFEDGCGPDVNGTTIDYVYFTPDDNGAKYPLVIYLHGMGQGKEPRAQIAENNFALWASDELQSRFVNGGAYLFVPRSNEDKGEFWPNSSIEPLKAAIDEFIEQNKDCIDISRIYIGGFSMGGSMTMRMIESYPSFFAASFPMCPAYAPSVEGIEAVADLPIWLIVSRFDVIAGYYTYSEDIWNTLCEKTNIPGDCRLSLFGKVTYPDKTKAPSNHYVWHSASNDMFNYDGSDYLNMVTTDAAGEDITLVYPDGLISWLCSFTSDYNGEELEPTGITQRNQGSGANAVLGMLRALIKMLIDTLKSLFSF